MASKEVLMIPNHSKVKDICSRHYGLSVHDILEQNTSDNIIFHLAGSFSSRPELNSENGYTLKIYNSETSSRDSFHDGYKQLHDHLTRKGIDVDHIVPTTDGKLLCKEPVPSVTGTEYCMVELAARVDGKHMIDIAITPSLLVEVGRACGKLDKCMQDFSHPGFEDQSRHVNLHRLPYIRHWADAVVDEAVRKIASDVISSFIDEIYPLLTFYQKGNIHGNLNLKNIYVSTNKKLDEGSRDTKRRSNVNSAHRVFISEFDKSVTSYPAFECATLIADVLTRVKSENIPLSASLVISGFNGEYPLNDTEMNHLRLLTCSKLAQHVLICSSRANSSLGGIDSVAGDYSRLLCTLWSMTDKQFLAEIKSKQ